MPGHDGQHVLPPSLPPPLPCPGRAYRLSAQKRDHIVKKQIENGMCFSNTQNFIVLMASTFPIVNKQTDTGTCHNNTHIFFIFILAYTQNIPIQLGLFALWRLLDTAEPRECSNSGHSLFFAGNECQVFSSVLVMKVSVFLATLLL